MHTHRYTPLIPPLAERSISAISRMSGDVPIEMKKADGREERCNKIS
jgi:hypothetical protein